MTPTDPAAVEVMIERLMAGDLCAVELAPEAAAMLRALAGERDEWRDKYNALAETALAQVSDLARQAGEAKGRLEASEIAGIVDGWIERCKAAEAEVAALREALTKMRGYAVHDDDCGLNALLMPRPPLTKQCTCGLSDLIKENHDG